MPTENSKKVLIVDDEDGFLDLLTMALESKGFEVQCAHDGVEGVEKAKSFLPEVILLDVIMPRTDGWEACRAMRKDKNLDKTKIILLTTSHKLKQAKEAGANEVMLKPFDLNLLVRAIDSPM